MTNSGEGAPPDKQVRVSIMDMLAEGWIDRRQILFYSRIEPIKLDAGLEDLVKEGLAKSKEIERERYPVGTSRVWRLTAEGLRDPEYLRSLREYEERNERERELYRQDRVGWYYRFFRDWFTDAIAALSGRGESVFGPPWRPRRGRD